MRGNPDPYSQMQRAIGGDHMKRAAFRMKLGKNRGERIEVRIRKSHAVSVIND